MKRIKNIVFRIIILNIVLCYELTTFSEMTFPLGMTSDGSTLVGSNMYNQAVIWTIIDGATIVGDGEFWGVSEDGKIAGSLYNSAGKEEAVIYENGIITYLGNVPGGNSCDAFSSSGLGISSDGTSVVGMGWENCGVESFYWNSIENMNVFGQRPQINRERAWYIGTFFYLFLLVNLFLLNNTCLRGSYLTL